jgi:hypothetical protein
MRTQEHRLFCTRILSLTHNNTHVHTPADLLPLTGLVYGRYVTTPSGNATLRHVGTLLVQADTDVPPTPV